ncbi:DUF2971 domain-containing protein [Aeromonas veronii]|uniref:DUF2971 domain-containing protein n=1 Tax=Aeromonas veronii TaxID=654 RepID=UPI003BA3A597
METFYKYSKYHGISSLIEPTIRLSPAKSLNDPFENKLNHKIKQSLMDNISASEIGFEIDKLFSSYFQQSYLMDRIQLEVDYYGIVSLTETPRNILMWAHYADEHRGVCIGYKNNFFDSLRNKSVDSISKAERYTPVKINYDNLRPQVISEEISIDEKLKAYVYQQLTTKSDEWIYEKEHRCIIPIKWADEVKIMKGSDADIDMGKIQQIQDLVKGPNVTKNENGSYVGEGLLPVIDFFKTYKGALFLKKIKKESIVSIHLGCRLNHDSKNEIISTVADKENGLSHVKVFECEPSQDRFEITAKRIL